MMTQLLRCVFAGALIWTVAIPVASAGPPTSAKRIAKTNKKKAKRSKREAKRKPKPVPASDDNDTIVVDDAPSETTPAAPRTLATTAMEATAETPRVSASAPRPRASSRGFYFRLGALRSRTTMSGASMRLETSLPVDPSRTAGSAVAMDQEQIPYAMIVGYKLPVLRRRLALETILGFPVKARFTASGPLADESLAPTFAGMATGIEPLGPNLAEATLASPIVTAVYRLPELGRVTVFGGAGAMVLLARGERVTNPVLDEAGDPKFTIAPSVGLVAQAGLELRLWRSLTARIDAKYVAPMKVEARVEDISITPKALPQVGTLEVGTAVLTTKISPFVVHAGVGVEF